MPLYKLADFDPNYRQTFGGDDIKSMDIYTEGGQRVGSVSDALVDDDGRFRYLVIHTQYDSANKRILLPIGLSRIDYNQGRVYVDGLSKEQVQGLPEYRDDVVVDYDYEEQIRKAYRPMSSNMNYNRDTYNYNQDASLYGLNEQRHQTFKLYEERLVAHKNRIKRGEVAVGKHVETETARVSVPIEKERVVIERVSAPSDGTEVEPSNLQFQEGEVARVEIYEETPEIYKEAFVREEVRVKKVVEHDTVQREDTIRREELDVETEGDLPVHRTDVAPTNPNT
jgi:uncharacterized protein (TIGR02271 family)